MVGRGRLEDVHFKLLLISSLNLFNGLELRRERSYCSCFPQTQLNFQLANMVSELLDVVGVSTIGCINGGAPRET